MNDENEERRGEGGPIFREGGYKNKEYDGPMLMKCHVKIRELTFDWCETCGEAS